jgi:protoporphyrinogen oxidase
MKTGLCPRFDVGFINEKNEWQENNPEVYTRGVPILGRQIHQGYLGILVCVMSTAESINEFS